MNHVSHEQTQPRSCPKVRPYEVWLWSEKYCIRQSANGLSRSKWLISLISNNLMSHVSHGRTLPRSWPKVSCPYQVWPRLVKLASGRALTEFNRSNSLIRSLSVHLMSYVSHEQTRPRSWTKVCPNQVWPWSEKNCTRESANEVWWTDAQTDRQTDRQTWSVYSAGRRS